MSNNQLKAIIHKNYHSFLRQKGTIFCQIITPLLCLLFIYLIKIIVEEQLSKSSFGIQLNIPILFNIPLYTKLQYSDLIIKFPSCDEWYLYDFTNNSIIFENKKYFLNLINSNDNILKYYCEQNKKINPRFNNIKNIINENNNNISINKYLYNILDKMNEYSYEELTFNQSIKSELPDGAITINNISNYIFSYKIQINDNRIPYYHRSNGITQFDLFNENSGNYSFYSNVLNGILWEFDLFNKAYIQNLFPNFKIFSGIQLMPLKIDNNEENIQRLINIAGATFYPLALTLLMPLFMYNIVIEKEKRLIEIMKINGLKMFNFWIGYMITDYVIYLITILVFSLVGIFILKLTLFINTSFILLFVLFILWGFNQIGLAFFFQSFVNNARSTTIIGYMVSLWTTLIAVSLNFSIYDIPNKFPIILLYYPTFNLCRIFYYMTYHCGYYKCLNNIYTIEQEVKNCYFILFTSGFVYIILGMYLYEIIPQEFGIRKHPLFFIKNLFQCKNINEININKNNINFTYKKLEEENLYDNNINEEDDLTKEQKIINNIIKTNTIKNYPLIVTNLTKIYNSNKNNYKSLDNFSLCLENNKIFSLLGPNGAGKTTFFSILTGIFPPTSGKAYIKGYNILTDIEKCQEQIGFCPQFDLLWNDLTVYEHLYFYCLLKNVDISNINDNIIKTLSDIKLEKFKNFLVRELSGGMKRRLSLGISLVGNPSVIFLDEPTTGLDPENKRQIWNILTNCKINKCMILTTHLMDEAEILSDRIGIIVHGHLKCIGSQNLLKKKFGKGFKLNISFIPYDNKILDEKILIEFKNEEEFVEERKKNIKKSIFNIFPRSVLIECYKNNMIFEISNDEFDSEKLFEMLEEKKNLLFIANWSISQVSLEDIFIRLTENDL